MRWPDSPSPRLVTGLLSASFFALISACVPGGDSGIGTTDSDGECASIESINLITDFEDGTGNLYPADNRKGLWYTFNDGSGEQFPPDKWSQVQPSRTGVCGSRFAMMTTARKFTGWGAGLGTDFRNIDGQKNPYDASNYEGISFWMKVVIPPEAPPVTSMPVRMGILDKNTAPEGKVCTAYGRTDYSPADNTTPSDGCNNKHGKVIFAQTEWKKYDFKFDQLEQENWGLLVDKLAVNALYGVQIQAQKISDFDLWIDNVAFIPKAE